MPDIDIDFDDRRRGEMVRYAADKWGSDRVAQVITFGTIKTKAALKDSARVHYGQPGFAIADRITKALPPPIMAKDIPLSGITDPNHERYKEAAEVRGLIDTDPDVRTIYETARGLEGLIRNAGVHACAVIMSSEPLIDAIPLWKRPQDGAVITGWDYPSCEAIGLLKMDFLGLRNLTIIGDALENIKANRGIDLDLESLPLDDPADLRAAGPRRHARGVPARRRPDARPAAPHAAHRLQRHRRRPRAVPARPDGHERPQRLRRPQEQPAGDQADPPRARRAAAEILAETYGLIVYQEQIMRIAQKVAGYSMAQADTLRKAMGKKKLEVLEEEYEGFSEGMKANGFSAAAVKALWDTILPFADYAFNKSHAAGYGLVSYWTAYLKANYPAEYMAGLLTSVGDDKDKAAVYLADCRRLGITVLPPDVNESGLNFASVGKDIRFGLGAVRNVGANVVASLINSRTEKGKYTDFSDYLNKIDIGACNKKVTESLIKAGAFDSLGHPRKGLFLVHTDAVDSVLGTKKAEAMGQFDLFGGADTATDAVFTIKVPEEEWEDKHKLALEREMLGLYVSGHPLNGVAHLLAAQVDTQIPAILDGDVANDTQVRVGGILASVNRRVNKNGLPWASAQLEDLTGGIEVLFFPQTYSMFGAEIADDAVVLVRRQGRDPRRPDLADRQRTCGAGLLECPGGPAAGGQPADPAVHRRQGQRAQAGAGPPSRHLPGASAADQRRADHDAGTRPVAAGDAVVGVDG